MNPNAPSSSRLSLALISLGASSLFFLQCLVAPHHHALYHLEGNASAIFIPLLVDVLLLAAILFTLLRVTLSRPALHRIVQAALLCLAPWAAYRSLSGSVRWMPLPSAPRDDFIAIAVSLLFVLFAFAPAKPVRQLFTRTWALAHAIFSIGGAVALVTLLQVTWLGFQARNLNDPAPFAISAAAPASPPRGRVLWIVFDELGYEQLNGDRLPNLALPNFDRFLAQASDLQHVTPAGLGTETVIPGLLTGSRVDSVWLSSTGRRFRLVSSKNSRLFDPNDTVFADARRLGYRNAIAGWYIPYCRMLASELSACAWSSHFAYESLYPSNSIAHNIAHPFLALIRDSAHLLIHPHDLSPNRLLEGREHIQDFVSLNRSADAALADPRLNFLLMHLPVPHPDGIWDRSANAFAIDHSNYIDNLVLADRYLGHVRSLLEANGEWDDATVLIIGDHGWRTTTQWSNDPTWSPDDQQASHNRRFDPRPAYLLKLPRQHQPAQLSTAFDALRTRALLDALLARRITTSAKLQGWIATQSTP